ncbi:MAG: DUF1294 domain-containing protein [Clostridiales bacterium]|nr:DUF1294 domain-containing protein [Candidatus Scatonaster coprocaballi]
MGIFDYYLITVNIIGFLLFLINLWLGGGDGGTIVDKMITVVSILGGSFGIIVAILIFARKPEKYNMMSRVFVSCVFVIQIVLLLVIKGHIADSITFAFWEFFQENKVLIVYLIVINVVTFAVYAIDKANAVEHRGRVRIVTLLALAFFGGSIGAIVAMYLLRHKTSKDYFTIGVPLIMVMQVIVLFYSMNAAW